MYRTRLMLVGKDRVGKTSLKKSLTGERLVYVRFCVENMARWYQVCDFMPGGS